MPRFEAVSLVLKSARLSGAEIELVAARFARPLRAGRLSNQRSNPRRRWRDGFLMIDLGPLAFPQVFAVRMRNISATGLSFLHDRPIDCATVLQMAMCRRGVRLNGAGEVIRIGGAVVRQRYHEVIDAYEHGVRFDRPLDPILLPPR